MLLSRKFVEGSRAQDLISNSPYFVSYTSRDVSLENLVLDQLIISYLIFPFIFITCLLDIVLIFFKEKFCLGHSWEVKG